ncbi:MAG: cytochrome c3 family protein [Bryobacterales bacterium]|nr:cytochrome c3 family protein [Bryobacterales bacterium]
MRHALVASGSAGVFLGRAPLVATIDEARYRLTESGGDANYAVEYGGETKEVPITWLFGAGEAGRTFILEHNGRLIESRVSEYRRIAGLDLTIGAANQRASSLDDAIGRPMGVGDVRECFGCHALGVPRSGEPSLAGIEAGVGCENCHGEGLAHVQARRSGDLSTGKLKSLKMMEAEDASQLCGSCHRTWEDVVEMRIRGVLNVRFQPYRLALSKCYDSADGRLSCVACHNPHTPVVRDATMYDKTCMACHGQPKANLAACSAGQTNSCTGCHMPKRELPGAHQSFADHYIQRPGVEGYPDL